MCQEQSHLSLGLLVKCQQSRITKRYIVLWQSPVDYMSSVHEVQQYAIASLPCVASGASLQRQRLMVCQVAIIIIITCSNLV
jgi:hypothetical protein